MFYNAKQDDALGMLFSICMTSKIYRKKGKMPLTELLLQYSKLEGKLNLIGFVNEVQFVSQSGLFELEYDADHWEVVPIPPTEAIEELHGKLMRSKDKGAGHFFNESKPPKSRYLEPLPLPSHFARPASYPR